MGYRNETEHLRHRVEQLEGELATLKGARRGGTEELFAARAKRQTILIAVLAMLASGTAGLCLLPTIVATLEFADEVVTPDEVAARTSYARVGFEGTLDVAHTLTVGSYYHGAPLAEDPRIIVACSWSCPYAVERELLDRYGAESRVLYGTVSQAGDYEFEQVDAYALEEHARTHGLTLADLRVVHVERREDPRPAFFFFVAIASLAALSLWVALLWHRSASRREAPLPTPSDYQTRDPGMTLILTIVTCRVYELVWIYLSTDQIRRLTGRRDLVPALDVLLSLMTFGLWTFWVFYRNVEAVDEALAETGYHTPQTGNVVGLTLGSFVCGVLQWLLIYKVQEAYNLLVIEKMDADQV